MTIKHGRVNPADIDAACMYNARVALPSFNESMQFFLYVKLDELNDQFNFCSCSATWVYPGVNRSK